jgi:hypothetical protein
MPILRNAAVAFCACTFMLVAVFHLLGASAMLALGFLYAMVAVVWAAFGAMVLTDGSLRFGVFGIAVTSGPVAMAGALWGGGALLVLPSLYIATLTGIATAVVLADQRAAAERAKRRTRRGAMSAAEKEARKRTVASSLESVSSDWLIDTFAVPENTARNSVIDMVTDLDDGTEHALKRAHRKGVKADDVAPLIAAGSFTEADADRLAREVA